MVDGSVIELYPMSADNGVTVFRVSVPIDLSSVDYVRLGDGTILQID